MIDEFVTLNGTQEIQFPAGVTFTKQWSDIQLGTRYNVDGNALSEQKILSIKGQLDKKNTRRVLIDYTENTPIVGSLTGAFKARRAYANLVIEADETAADALERLQRLAAILLDENINGPAIAGQL